MISGKNSIQNSQNGFISVDFIFAITIAFSMSIVVFAMTYTLSVIEVTQYLVYSSARAHAASNADQSAQVAAAKAKYAKLLADNGLNSVYANGWFTVTAANQLDIRSGDRNFENDYPAAQDSNREVFTGVRTNLRANILELNLPLVGSIAPEDGDGFTTRVAGILIREPSTEECRNFYKQKAEKIWDVNDGRFTRFKSATAPRDLWEDNGC
jgi:hypothetical protein